jgi:peptidyl-prolyl cis-trans isomerase A (cyclophilin A)
MRNLLLPISCALATTILVSGCESAPAEPTATKASADVKPKVTVSARPAASARQRPPPPKPVKRKVEAKPVATVKPSEDDPLKGKWTLADATKGLTGGKQLTASIETSMGTLECKLFSDKAPLTVANFVGLARGTRPWKTPEGKWEKKPAYDGTIFHRIIKGFMIQGGDPKKNGQGEPGYVIPDEVWEDANHDRPGQLCMANRGPNTNGAQFFITDEPALNLDGGYTIFGECGPVDKIHEIAAVETERDRPKTQVDIKSIKISLKAEDWTPPGLAPAPAPPPAASGTPEAGPSTSASAAASAAAKPAASASPKAGATTKVLEPPMAPKADPTK